MQFILKNERYNLGSKKIIIKNNLCDEEEKIIFQKMGCFWTDVLKYRILDELKEGLWVLVTNAWLRRQQYKSISQMKEVGEIKRKKKGYSHILLLFWLVSIQCYFFGPSSFLKNLSRYVVIF